MFVAGHFDGIHAGDTIVRMIAPATFFAFVFHAVDKIGFVDERTSHLYEFESVVEHLFDRRTSYQTTHINEGKFQCFSKFERIVQKIGLSERGFGYHESSGQFDTVF